VADIKIGLSTVIGDKDLAMGIWIHRAGIDINIRIYLDSGDTITRSREKTSYRSSNNTLTQATQHPSSNNYVFHQHQTHLYKSLREIKEKPPRNREYGKYTQYYCKEDQE
jgi:hypothetical protein